MKKYITIAALLAAGSAFANAESLTLDNAVGYLSLVDGVLTPSAENITYSNGTLSVTDGNWTSFNNTRTVSTIAMTFDAALLAAGLASSAQPLVELDGDSADWGLGLSSSGMFTGTWVLHSNGTTNYAYFTSGHGVSSDSTGNITVVISLGDKGTRIWEDDSTFWSSSGLKAKLDTTGNVSAINLSELAVSALNNIVVWNVDTYTADNAPTDAEGAASAMATSVSLIPEPSAFGLLAGLGALALVASRRRRSR
ncbi:MAG: PEP-CTERM sorting domain-containing protein [Opitutales bacterium]|nr:PEP-CTERM sorting domain-containing protein [Opitutales bacterium]